MEKTIQLKRVYSRLTSVLSGIPEGSNFVTFTLLQYIKNVLLDFQCIFILIYIYMPTMQNCLDITTSQDVLLLQNDINKLSNWTFECRLFKFNINKCKVLSYGRNTDHAQFEQLKILGSHLTHS